MLCPCRKLSLQTQCQQAQWKLAASGEAVGCHCQPKVKHHSSCKTLSNSLGMQLNVKVFHEPLLPRWGGALQLEASAIYCPLCVSRSMPHYPNIDQENDYIMSRFDGCLIDGLAWSQAALVTPNPEGSESAMEAASSGLGLSQAKQQSAARQGRAAALQELNEMREVRACCMVLSCVCLAA